MLPTLGRSIILCLPARMLNILLSPGGDGNLLGQVDDILSPSSIHRGFTFSSLTLIFTHFVLSNLVSFLSFFFLEKLSLHNPLRSQVRYVLGHSVATLLILESSRADGGYFRQHECQDSKRHPIFRNIFHAVRLIYRNQGVCLFSRGLGIAVIYELAHCTVEIILSATVFRHRLLRPFAYAIPSVLLCQLHLVWTCTTISAVRLPLRSLLMQANTRKWRNLAAPIFIYGILRALMYQVLDFMEWSDTFTKEQVYPGINVRASAEVLAGIFLLALRVLALLPASIILTLTEASLLPGTLETIIPSPEKRRGAVIVELLGGTKIPLDLSTFIGALRPFDVSRVLWLVELHLKKCLVQIVFELLALSLLRVAIE